MEIDFKSETTASSAFVSSTTNKLLDSETFVSEHYRAEKVVRCCFSSKLQRMCELGCDSYGKVVDHLVSKPRQLGSDLNRVLVGVDYTGNQPTS